MKLAGFYDESISNGIGWRAVVFVSGCPHNCPGCQNFIAQDYNYGTEFDKDKIIKRICDNSILNGVTLSGGEPLCKENIEGLLDFVKDLKLAKPNFNIWCYSGYTLEELIERNDEKTNEMLKNIDVLVDGRFILNRRNPELKFRGSDNQRIIDVKKSLTENKIIKFDV